MSELDPKQPPEPLPAPLPEPPPKPPKRDWLRTMARATETVAPLVARQAPKAEDIPADRRGRWATALAITGILVAVLQFLVQFYDLVTRPLAPLAGALPYLAAGLLLAGAGVGVYALLHARTRRQRLVSAGATFVALLVAGSWGGWLAYDALRPPDGYRILVAEFQASQGAEYIDFSRRIAENLHTQLADAGLPIEIKRTPDLFPDAETARREGAKQKAGLVIWGWYDAQGVSPHVEVLSLPGPGSNSGGIPNIPIVFATANAAANTAAGSIGGAPALQPVLNKLAPVTAPPLTLPSLDLFTQYGADQMAYVASTVLAMSYLANDDLEGALALFDQGLASVAGDPTAAQGQEVVHYQRATANYRLGRYAAARADLEQALQLQPDYAPAHLLLAAILANHCTPDRDLATALAAARQAAALQSDDPAAHRLLADLLLRSGDAAGARQSAEAARQLDPNSIDTGVLLAAIYTALDQPAESLAAREAVLALAKQAAAQPAQAATAETEAVSPADVFYQLGDAYLALDRYEEALAAYAQAQQVAPQDARLHHARGNVLYWQGKHAETVAEYTAWAQRAPDDPMPHVLLGFLYAARGEREQALAQYTQAAALGVCDPVPYLLLGGAQVAAGDYTAARSSYGRALEIEPHNPDALYAAGANSLLLADYAAAAEQFGALVARQPALPAAHYYLGEALTGLGETQRAQAAYAEAVALEENGDPTLYLAYAYERLGRTDDAITVYVRLLAEGESADLHAYLGALYAGKGAMSLARQEYEAALALNPEQRLALAALGGMAAADGDYAGAVAHYESYLAQEKSADIHSFAAAAYRQLGDLPAALRHLQAAMHLQPDDPGLAQQLATVANWLNQLDTANAAVDGALRLRPDDPALYFLAGQLAYKRCDLPAAVAALERTVALAPANSLYRGSLGGYLQAQGKDEQMQEHLAQLRAAPADDLIAHWTAGALLAQTDGVAARAEYGTALAAPDLLPGVAAALHTALGQVAYTAKDYAAAAAEFEAALAQAPDYAEAESALGDLALLAGDVEAAATHYRQAQMQLSAYAANYAYESAGVLEPLLHVRLALVARRQGDAAGEQAALQAAQAALAPLQAAAPGWPVLLAAQGMAALVQGDEATADVAFARAVACDQTMARVRGQVEELSGFR